MILILFMSEHREIIHIVHNTCCTAIQTRSLQIKNFCTATHSYGYWYSISVLQQCLQSIRHCHSYYITSRNKLWRRHEGCWHPYKMLLAKLSYFCYILCICAYGEGSYESKPQLAIYYAVTQFPPRLYCYLSLSKASNIVDNTSLVPRLSPS